MQAEFPRGGGGDIIICVSAMSTEASQPTAVTEALPTIGARPAGRLRQAGRDLLYLVAVLATSIVAFCVWVTGLSLTVSLLVFVVGVFVWVGCVYAFRVTTRLDRALAAWIRREPLPAVYRQPQEPGFLALLRCVSTDPQTWRDLAWMLVHSVLGFGLAVIGLTATFVVLAFITLPAWWWAIPDPEQQWGTLNFGFFLVDSTAKAFLVAAVGVALAPLAAMVNRGAASGHSHLAVVLLAPSDAQRLRARVEELSVSRAGAVAASQEQLERIERDLHDGAQARLVALAMELGMAEQRLAAAGDEEAVESVRRAREEALAALAELRDLSRGLRPALLEERGLGAAIEALAARSALPVTVTMSGSLDDLPEATQTAAYFVVAEALTNAAKHSGAERALVRLERRERSLAIAVEDRGRGGADPNGSGIGGLRSRVAALDGHLEVVSPPGGPTTVSAEIPCP